MEKHGNTRTKMLCTNSTPQNLLDIDTKHHRTRTEQSAERRRPKKTSSAEQRAGQFFSRLPYICRRLSRSKMITADLFILRGCSWLQKSCKERLAESECELLLPLTSLDIAWISAASSLPNSNLCWSRARGPQRGAEGDGNSRATATTMPSQ